MGKRRKKEPERHVRISGPATNGHFLIHDIDNNVWDGKCWRGFGPAKLYATFQLAFLDAVHAGAEEINLEPYSDEDIRVMQRDSARFWEDQEKRDKAKQDLADANEGLEL